MNPTRRWDTTVSWPIFIMMAEEHKFTSLREYGSDPDPFTTKALENFTLEATAPSLAQPTARTEYRPIPPNPYLPNAPSPYQHFGPGPSHSTNPGLYRDPFAASGLPTAIDSTQQSASASTQLIHRGPVYPDREGKGQEKGKRQRSETPGVEAESSRPRRRPFDPVPRRRHYDPVRDG